MSWSPHRPSNNREDRTPCAHSDANSMPAGRSYALISEIRWMAENAPHLDFKMALEQAKIDEQVCHLLLRCQKEAAGGAS